MHRQQQVVLGGVAERGAERGRVVELPAVQQLGVGEAGDAPVLGEPAVHGDPGQRARGAGLGGPARGVGGGEADPALVGDDPGVAALSALQLGVAEVGEFGGGEAGGQQVGVGDQGGAELAQQVAGGVAAQPEDVPGVDQEAQRVEALGVVAVDGAGVDEPAPVGAAAGGEAVLGRGQGECPAVRCPGTGPGRGEELLVGELAEHLGEQRTAGPLPMAGGELRRQVQRRFSGRRLRHGSAPGVGGEWLR